MSVTPELQRITDRIIANSRKSRAAYLEFIAGERDKGVHRPTLSCGNLAHGFAASGDDKPAIRSGKAMNIGIVSAFNDMLSAHQPYGRYPELIKIFAREVGATAQVAGGVPAMCDGVTQGQPGMELSLLSRDNIAMGAAIALSHGMFEGALMLGICDKIVPGLLIAALRFGHLPTIFVPAGPMPSGLANKEKQRVRQLYAEGKASEAELLDAESASYHGAGTCTFYGTANSNQMMMEMMGLHVPASAFINPGGKLRQELTRAAVHRITQIGWAGDDYRPIGQCIDEKAIINAAIGLMATGGSTNHAIHLPAIARSAGIAIDWQDLSDLSAIIPLVSRVYPNGSGDVNHFHAAGGIGFIIRDLADAGLLHTDVLTVSGDSLRDYAVDPTLNQSGEFVWMPSPDQSRDESILRPASAPFQKDGGMRLLTGNLGRGIIKTSAVDPSRWAVEARCRVFADQNEVKDAFQTGELDRDVIIVVRFQGPKANGMPELHKLTPLLGVLQDKGFKVALVTDGRMSGASGKVPSAIHIWPEASDGGPLSQVQDGDLIRLDANNGTLQVLVDKDAFDARAKAVIPHQHIGVGRELFALMRSQSDNAEAGASAMLNAAGL